MSEGPTAMVRLSLIRETAEGAPLFLFLFLFLLLELVQRLVVSLLLDIAHRRPLGRDLADEIGPGPFVLVDAPLVFPVRLEHVDRLAAEQGELRVERPGEALQ